MLYFILGIIFAYSISILESLTGLIIALIEKFKTKISISIASNSMEIQKINQGFEAQQTQTIGFGIPTEDIEFIEDESE